MTMASGDRSWHSQRIRTLWLQKLVHQKNDLNAILRCWLTRDSKLQKKKKKKFIQRMTPMLHLIDFGCQELCFRDLFFFQSTITSMLLCNGRINLLKLQYHMNENYLYVYFYLQKLVNLSS